MGTVQKIYIAEQKRGQPAAVPKARLEAGKGIVGDRYHARASELQAVGERVPQNHLTLIAKEELDRFLSEYGLTLDYSEFRRNIVTSGIDLNELTGKRFRVGGVLCHGAELCEPCAWLASTVHPGVVPGLVHKAGLRATILSSGEVEVGAEISAQ